MYGFGVPGAWRTRTIALIVAGFAGAFVYSPVIGVVNPEYSDFALAFGQHSWYRPLDLSDILGKYLDFDGAWYRPTSIYAAPYLLRIDYFQPGTQAFFNVAFFSLTSTSIVLFFRQPRLLPALVAMLMVLLAPALYLVSYGVTIDSLYVLFSLIFLLCSIRLYHGQDRGRTRWFLIGSTVLAFGLAVTSKEIAVGAAFLLFPALLVAGPALTLAEARRAVRFCAPFVLLATVYAVVYYTIRDSASGGVVYETDVELHKLDNSLDLLLWSLGFKSPESEFAHWIPPWGSGEKALQAVLLAAVLTSVALAWRTFGIWRISLYAATYLVLAVAIAFPGGLPHHAYPLVVMYGVAALAGLSAVATRLERAAGVLRYGFAAMLVVLLGFQLIQARRTFMNVLAHGPHTPFLEASTELFYGSALDPVRAAPNPLLIFEDCLGGLHNPLRYYARSASGHEIVVSRYDAASLASEMNTAVKRGEEVFVARCTGTSEPWYAVERYTGPTRRG